jgi:hypothetical protein
LFRFSGRGHRRRLPGFNPSWAGPFRAAARRLPPEAGQDGGELGSVVDCGRPGLVVIFCDGAAPGWP